MKIKVIHHGKADHGVLAISAKTVEAFSLAYVEGSLFEFYYYENNFKEPQKTLVEMFNSDKLIKRIIFWYNWHI